MTEQIIRNKSFDERTGKRIASFEPRERTMEVQKNHQFTVRIKPKIKINFEDFHMNRMV